MEQHLLLPWHPLSPELPSSFSLTMVILSLSLLCNVISCRLSFLSVDAGNRAVIFDKIQGIQQTVKGEGTHFKIPFIQVSAPSESVLTLIHRG